LTGSAAFAQTHGRKYQPPPATSHIVVTVEKGFNSKPLVNAAVIFHATKDGKDTGNMEVKTNNEGEATMDFIEAGSHVTVQVIANGFATHAEACTGAARSAGAREARTCRDSPGWNGGTTAVKADGTEFKPLAGKHALVTGGAKRIGRALALALAEAGADVAFTYRGSKFEAEQTLSDLKACGVNAYAMQCDVRDEASVQAAVAEAVERMHGLDVLVNNAGAFETVALEKISVAEWDAMFETNTRGPFLMAKAAHGALKASQGRIVNIGSLGGFIRGLLMRTTARQRLRCICCRRRWRRRGRRRSA